MHKCINHVIFSLDMPEGTDQVDAAVKSENCWIFWFGLRPLKALRLRSVAVIGQLVGPRKKPRRERVAEASSRGTFKPRGMYATTHP